MIHDVSIHASDTQCAIEGRFVVEEIRARGAMGSIARGVDLWSGSRVAIKRMLAPGLDVARFQREADVLGRLSHDGIVKCIASGKDEVGPWIVMEWLDGRDLATVLEAGPVQMPLALELAAQLAEAVSAAHSCGVVHRDIKPANVVVLNASVPRLKLVDFGVAKDLDATAVLTATGSVVGTPLYMAPEQLRGEPVGPRTDVYAIAAVVYEVMAGHPPFVAETAFAAVARVLLDDPPRLEAMRPDVPGDVVDAIHAALVKDAAKRCDLSALVSAFRCAATAMQEAPTRYQPKAEGRAALLAERRRTAAMVIRVASDRDAVRSVLDDQVSAHATLPDGTVLAQFTDPTSPDVPVLRAVRAGLELVHRVPDAIVVIASGMSDTRDDSTAGEGFRRAGVLDPEEPGVHVDRATAGIVARRFELAWHEHSAKVVRHTDDERSSLVLGKATPTVGRDAEVAQLVALLASAEENGVPRIAIVEGSAGMGKSRVRREVTRTWVSRGDRVCLTAAFEPDSMRSSWAGFTRAIRVFCGIRAGQPLDVQREQLALLARRARLSDRAEALLAEVARAATPADAERLSAARSSPELMREGVQDAMESLLRGLAGNEAVLLVLEDAHWADRASLDLVGALAALPDLPLAAIAFARPTLLAAQPDLWSLRAPLRLHLPPLSVRAAGKLARSVLPEATAQRVVDDVVELAAGNPLVLEELVRMVADRGEIATTDTARAVFEARLGLLHGEERVVARAAAVVGEVFWEAAVAALVEGSDLDVASALAALERRELITRRGGSRYEGQPDLSFRHALVRDAALAMVPEDASVVLHGRLARWLVSVGDLDAAVIAAHAEAGGLSEMAGEMYAKAAHAALAAQDLPTAAALLDKAGALVPRSDVTTRWDLDLALESLCRELALDRRRVRHLAGLRRAARIRGDARMRAIALTREARFRCDRNEHHDGVSLGIEAVRLAREVYDPTSLAEAAIWTSLSAREASKEDHAVLDEALSTPGVPAHHRALLLRTRGTISRRRGRAQDAVADYQVALSLCDEVGSRIALAESLCALSYATYVWGELSRAREHVDRALQVRKTIGSRLDVAKLLANHGNVCIAVGDWGGAARWIEASLVEHRRGVDPEAHVDSIILRARCFMETGEFGAAADCLEQAERRLTRTRANYDFAHLELVRGWLEARRSTWDHALARFDGCRSAASLGGAAALLAVGDGWRARALAELDRNDEARAGARDALRQLEGMDASEWAGETFFAIANAQVRADPECLQGTLARARRWANDFEERIGDDELRERFRGRADVRWLRGGDRGYSGDP